MLFALVGATLIISGRILGCVHFDQELYHRPTINQFLAQWPDFDFWHYLSATTPGYHLLMAAVAKFISPSIPALQTATLIISLPLAWILSFAVARRAAPLMALCLCVPFLFSPYVTASAAWLLPDNLGWLGVLAILLIALRPRLTIGAMIAGGAILLGLVFVRQIHAWTAGLLWASAWLAPSTRRTGQEGPDGHSDSPPDPSLATLFFGDLGSQVPRTLLCIALTLPALGLLALFFRFWGGPVPPVFQSWYHAIRPGAAVQLFALFGVWGLFFSATWIPHLLRFWRTRRAWLVTIIGIFLVAGLAVRTNDFAAARHTGIWGQAERFPTIGHTSPVMLGLMLLGALPIASLLFAAPARQRMIFLAALVGFAAANAANSDLFQRYYDPFILMLLALMSATAASQAHGGASARTDRSPALWALLARIQPVGPLLLALIFAALSIKAVTARNAQGEPIYAHIGDPPPGAYVPSNPNDEEPPCVKPRPPKPADRHFWPWN